MAAAVTAKPDYGLDDPLVVRRWFGRAGWFLAIGIFVWFINQTEYPAPSLRILITFAALAVLCCGVAWFKIRSSREGKLSLREQLLDSVGFQGDEKVLDIGCGLGILSIAVAKRLKTGKVTGIDNWDPQVLSGNSIEAAKENSKSEGVADRVRFESGDGRKLVYPDANFDAVLAFRYLRTLADDLEREKAIREMFRVLKPGGRILIFDGLDTTYYSELLVGLGAQNLCLMPWNFLWLTPERSITATK